MATAPGDQLILPDPTDRAGHRETQRLLDDGLLRALPGGVLVGAHVPDTTALRAAALRAAVTRPGRAGPGDPAARAVIGYRTAAWLHCGGPAPEVVDLVIAPGTARPKGIPVRLREHRLHPRHVQTVGGVQATTPTRTAADLARGLPPEQVGRELERLGRECGVRLIDVVEELDGMRNAQGVARARRVVLAWASLVASAGPGPISPAVPFR